VAEAKRPDSRGLSFFDITDFSPGIYDNGLIAGGSVEGIFPAPPGAADATATFGCMSLPNGGLGSMCSLSGVASLGAMGITGRSKTDIIALTNSFQTNADELVFGINTLNLPSAGFQRSEFYSFLAQTPSLHQIATADYNFTSHENFCTYPFSTVVAVAGTIQPQVVLPLTAPDGPNSDLYVYPPPTAPTTFSTSTITTQPVGTSFGHQGRVVAIQINNGYGWPVAITQFPNEAFSYTDPPESSTWPHQFEIFGPENPFGYGAVNSVSAGELFCVKCRGGAIVIQGDLNNPTVTSLPGVRSTGFIYGRTDTDQNGMYYCADRQGAWLWNGGNTSQKISNQLDDEFFATTNLPGGINSPFYGYYIQRWSDWMLFNNNWIYNSTAGSWWRLADPSVNGPYFWYVPGYDSKNMFMGLATVPNSATNWLFQYDRSVPGPFFTWQSLPIKIPSEDRTSTAREVVIRASNPYGDAAPQIGVTLIDDKGNLVGLDTWTMTAGINTIQETRLNARLSQTTTVAVRLSCGGTTFAPVVHGLSMGYRVREHVGLS
jgi:hypothetical protein